MPQTTYKYFIVSAYLLACTHGNAQPFIDIGKVSYYYTPSSDKPSAIYSKVYSINVTLPIELKKDGDVIIMNPFYDNNNATTGTTNFHVNSIGIMIGFLKKNITAKWDLMTSVIVRRNKQVNEHLNNTWQGGGLLLATFKQNQSRSFKLGVYYNREFFGNFFMPLAGIDWKINDRTNLFGVLPGNMTVHRRLTQRFYFGSTFRALTNSYRIATNDPCTNGNCSTKNYLRINDNQLGIFAEVLPAKRIVFTAEVGHTILRKYRNGTKSHIVHTYTDFNNDNWYAKGSLAYRINIYR